MNQAWFDGSHLGLLGLDWCIGHCAVEESKESEHKKVGMRGGEHDDVGVDMDVDVEEGGDKRRKKKSRRSSSVDISSGCGLTRHHEHEMAPEAVWRHC